MLIQSPQRVYKTWIIDSPRWERYRPRADDIVIATYPKCGTTWMQRIVGVLLSQSPEPQPIWQLSPWIDRRFPEPLDDLVQRMEAQTHRRFFKSHLPLDGLPYYDQVRYIHVARDGRDACMSYHNHVASFTPEFLAGLTKAGLEDQALARPYPRLPADPAEFFHHWITQGVVPGDADGSPLMSYFHCEQSWWDARRQPNVLLVHYNDLKSDLVGEMSRIAEFLSIAADPALLPELAAASTFAAMRRDGDALMGAGRGIFQDGSASFFFQGSNDRWRGTISAADLALYEAKARALPSGCSRWLAGGRRVTGDSAAE